MTSGVHIALVALDMRWVLTPPALLLTLCRERLREAERQAAKEAAAERERARLVKADIVALDEPDDGLPPWQRRPYSIT